MFVLLSPSFSVYTGPCHIVRQPAVCSKPLLCLPIPQASSFFFHLNCVPSCLIATCNRLVDYESQNSHSEILTTKAMMLWGGALGGDFYPFEKILEGASTPFAVWHCRDTGSYEAGTESPFLVLFSETEKHTSVLCKAIHSVVLCYSSLKRLTRIFGILAS